MVQRYKNYLNYAHISATFFIKCHNGVRILCDILFVIPDPDVMAGRGEGIPGNVEPVGAGQELVGEGVTAEEFHELSKLLWVSRANVGGLPDEVLRVVDASDLSIDCLAAEA